MSYTTQLAEVYSLLSGVTNIANVYDYPRYTDNLTTFDTRFLDGTVYHFWWIERTTTNGAFAGPNAEINEVWEIHGFYGWDDANSSYKTFQAIIDNVLDDLNASTEACLNDTGFILEPAILTAMEPFQFATGPLLHHAVIELKVLTDEAT